MLPDAPCLVVYLFTFDDTVSLPALICDLSVLSVSFPTFVSTPIDLSTALVTSWLDRVFRPFHYVSEATFVVVD